jgi:hypothetical protein
MKDVTVGLKGITAGIKVMSVETKVGLNGNAVRM